MKESIPLLTCAFLAGLCNACKSDTETKPNIVFILIDDMGWKDPRKQILNIYSHHADYI